MKDEKENNLMNLETILLTNMATIFIFLLSFILSKADDDLQWQKKEIQLSGRSLARISESSREKDEEKQRKYLNSSKLSFTMT